MGKDQLRLKGAGAPGMEPREANELPVYRVASVTVAAIVWAYVIAFPGIVEFSGLSADQLDWLASWSATPLQAVALAIGGWLLTRPNVVPEPQRLVWWFMFAFTALNAVATVVWNTIPRGQWEQLSIAGELYVLDYWILIAGFAVLYARLGGSFRTLRVWLDGATMMAVQWVALWSLLWRPFTSTANPLHISATASVAYAVTLTALLTWCALVCIQLPNYRGRPGVLLLAAGVVAIVAWEMNWLASWMLSYDLDGSYYNYGDVLGFACIITAAAAAQSHPPLPSEAVNRERQVYSFLPALVVLVTIALVASTLATSRRRESWIVVGLVGLCAKLLLARQLSVRKELRALNHLLATREADSRLTELVRRSDDLIIVANADGVVSYASPASETLLGATAAQIQGRRAAVLFGANNTATLEQLIERVAAGTEIPEVLQLQMERAALGRRALKLCASNQLLNPVIRGLVLTVQDVTSQRALEREVLDIATRERVRLCADIHDGLGQELTGIALLLHAAATAPDPDLVRQRHQLQSIVEQVNRTIGTARDLARGLSPLHVVRGSLGQALRRLAQEPNGEVPISLEIDTDFDDRVIGDFAADHLYRIAQEAVANALRHSRAGRIHISLGSRDETLCLSIADDGRGLGRRSAENHGIGLKLMEYRANMVGGTLRAASERGSGTRIDVTLPLPSPATKLGAARLTAPIG